MVDRSPVMFASQRLPNSSQTVTLSQQVESTPLPALAQWAPPSLLLRAKIFCGGESGFVAMNSRCVFVGSMAIVASDWWPLNLVMFTGLRVCVSAPAPSTSTRLPTTSVRAAKILRGFMACFRSGGAGGAGDFDLAHLRLGGQDEPDGSWAARRTA